jgi:type I restriction-modification system DNA methylase subunit
MAVVKKHSEGEKGKRGCDSIAHAFGTLVEAMEKTRKDILGDLFQGAISYGEAGQFLTPEPVCELMARMTMGEDVQGDGAPKSISDPCCGSGRFLLAATEIRPGIECVGQDVDLRCVRMTAINLALRNRYGYVIWGNTFKNEHRLVYRTGFNLRGFVREAPVGDVAPTVEKMSAADPISQTAGGDAHTISNPSDNSDTSRKPPNKGWLF